jgi:drug/metabolite transporter (DMT)-like permease
MRRKGLLPFACHQTVARRAGLGRGKKAGESSNGSHGAAMGVGITSSVIPYVFDQLAMRRLARSTYALMVALLPATAAVIGILVLAQIPTPTELLGVGLVIVAVVVHRQRDPTPAPSAAD